MSKKKNHPKTESQIGEKPKRRSKLWMMATGTALATAGLIAAGLDYVFTSYQTKIENRYNVKILGDFSDEELKSIDGALEITYKKLPGTPKHLELVIKKIQLSKNMAGQAVPNCSLSLEEIEKAKTFKDLWPNNPPVDSKRLIEAVSDSSNEVMSQLLDKYLTDIEKSQADILGLNKDSFDLVLLDKSQHYRETVIHELSHVILEEYFKEFVFSWDAFLTEKGWVSDYAEKGNEKLSQRQQVARACWQIFALLPEILLEEKYGTLLQKYKPRIEHISKGLNLTEIRNKVTEDMAETLEFMLLDKEPRDKLPGVQKKMDAINTYLKETGFTQKE